MIDLYGDMASGLKECLTNMGPWSLGDLTLGIRHVGKRHDRQDISDRLPGPPVQGSTSPDIYAFLRREIKITQAAYSIPDAPAIAVKAELPNDDCILHMSIETAKFQPAYMLIKDTEAKLLRIVVRGTSDLHDVLTDMAGVAVPYQGGSAHEGMLQAANWLLDETVPLLEQLPREELIGYGLRFSGHSLGAGTAALATYIIHTRSTAAAYKSLRSIFPLPSVSCFCASPPPVLSLSLAHSTQQYMTTVVLDHDVVSRASIANFEQLRLEVLASGWWNDLVDPVVKSSVFDKVVRTLDATGANQLVQLIGVESNSGSAPGTSSVGASSSTETRDGGTENGLQYARNNMHHLFTQPTTQQRAAEKASTSDVIKGFVDSYMESSRKSSSEYSTRVLAKASALSKRPKHELVAVAAASASAAAAAWWASAPKRQQNKTEDASRSGTSASPATDGAESGSEKKGSWMGTLAWAAQAATAAYAAGSAASKTVSAAGDIAQFLSPEDAPKQAQATTSTNTPPARSGVSHRGQFAEQLTPPAHPVGTEVPGGHDLSNLDQSISSTRLYAPGRLYHLQRTTATPDVEEVEYDDEKVKEEDANAGASSWLRKKGKKKDHVLQRFVLVRGEPPEARFEFIAVRPTWISDHLLDPMLEALTSAETGQPVPGK